MVKEPRETKQQLDTSPAVMQETQLSGGTVRTWPSIHG